MRAWCGIGGAVALLVGCGSSSAETEEEPIYEFGGEGMVDSAVDRRNNLPPPPGEGEGLQWVTPQYVIAPGTELQVCAFDTYRGETVGMATQVMAQSRHGHHVAIFGTTVNERDFPDGTVINCTEDTDFAMDNLEPLLLAGSAMVDGEWLIGSDENGQADFELPDGMAARLKEGQRIIIQSHYVNTESQPIIVQDALNVTTVAEAEVDVWAAPFITVDTEFKLPPQAETTVQFDCDVEKTGHLLYIGGHMHEWGKWFELDINRPTMAAEEFERVYDIMEWKPELRDQAVMRSFAQDEFPITEGDVFRTTCHFENDTDSELDHPQEMCVSFGMMYPSKTPVICSPPGQ